MVGQNMDENTLFVISTTKSLIPLLKLKKDDPVVFAVTPSSSLKDELNLLEDERFLKHL